MTILHLDTLCDLSVIQLQIRKVRKSFCFKNNRITSKVGIVMNAFTGYMNKNVKSESVRSSTPFS